MANLEQRIDVTANPLYEVTVNDPSSGEGGGGERAVFQIAASNFVSHPVDMDAAIQAFALSLVALNPSYTVGTITKTVVVGTTLQ